MRGEQKARRVPRAGVALVFALVFLAVFGLLVALTGMYRPPAALCAVAAGWWATRPFVPGRHR